MKNKNVDSRCFLITGGAGFIGSAVIRYLIKNTKHNVINVDSLTYAGNIESLVELSSNERYKFFQLDICNKQAIVQLFNDFCPDIVMHLAAETHVDRSIDSPLEFINTNILGTSYLLEITRKYWLTLVGDKKLNFRFHHVSTDEVYGSLDKQGMFVESSAYKPSSPYSASKASSDHLVRSWNRTYGLPVVISNCSNNYGPYQFPEKLVPLVTLNALRAMSLPIYGSGNQIRDWLYVDDHADALYKVATEGKSGETYNVGGNNEKTNLEVVQTICSILDELAPNHPVGISKYKELITFVEDRPGHDMRYAIDASKIKKELGWVPVESFHSGIRKTIQWYLDNSKWWKNVQASSYHRKHIGY